MNEQTTISKEETTVGKKQLSQILYDNAVGVMKKDLYTKVEKSEENLMEQNVEAISSVSDKISEMALSDLNIEAMDILMDGVDRHSYNFPSIFKVGMLKTWSTTPSKIIHGEQFYSGIPFYLPIGLSGIGVFENQKFKKDIISIIETNVLRMISSLPTALSRLTIIDKNGSGQNLPTLLGFHDKITGGKILSEDSEIERELLDLKHSMTVVTQSITANGFNSVEQYNKETEEIAQPYKILAISNFPHGFSKKSAESLLSIIESGPKAGIHVFMTFAMEPKQGMNQPVNGIPLIEFTKHLTMFEFSTKIHEFTRLGLIDKQVNVFNIPLRSEDEFRQLVNNRFKIVLESVEDEESKKIVKKLNENIEHVNIRPVIDIKKTIPQDFWTGDSGMGVCMPFAKSGIENIFLSLGINNFGEAESTHHGIIGGATGSGKTVMLHDMILHGAMAYSPHRLNFWLLDYKEGTEFATYKDFPYVQILSMESEVEFGQQVLEKAISIMSQRGELFKKVGASNLITYNGKAVENGLEILPRILIIIDEFQALFPKNPRITAKTNDLIDRILRLGRSFGINLLLATQTLKGIDLDENLLSNMPLRIALKMDEKDAVKLFGDENPAPRYLENPGEGIYNKSYGNSTANVHFQAYLALGKSVDDTIDLVKEHMDKTMSKEEIESIYKKRFVYNGDEPGKIENNKTLLSLQKRGEPLPNGVVYIGEEAGLSKEHSSFLFETDFADNLLIVGSDIDKAFQTVFMINKQLEMHENENQIIITNYNKKFIIPFQGIEKASHFGNRDANDSVDIVYEEYLKRRTLSEEDIRKQTVIYMTHFFIDSSGLFTDTSRDNKHIDKVREMIKDCSEYGIHFIIFATNFNMLMTADMSRDLDKFKKKIAFKGGNSLKIFGEAASTGLVEFSRSGNVAIASSSNIGDNFFKFKPYNIDKDISLEELSKNIDFDSDDSDSDDSDQEEEIIIEYEKEDNPEDVLLEDGIITEEEDLDLEKETELKALGKKLDTLTKQSDFDPGE